MKAFARVSGITVLLMMALTLALAGSAFAAEAVGSTDGALRLLSSSPGSGAKDVPIENVGVKLYFSGDVTADTVWAANKNSFKLLDDAGGEAPYVAYQGQKVGEEGYILVLADPTPVSDGQPGQLAQKSDYTLMIPGTLTAADGATLGDDVLIQFTTMDVAANSRLSMILMVVMMGAIIALMFVTNWRKMKAEAEAAALLKANPYKIAKERKISLDEAKELIEKAREKNQKQLAKVGGKAPVPEEKKSAAPRLDTKMKKKNTHRVKGPRPISEGGSTFRSGRKAEKERKARAEAARKAASGQRRSGGGSGSKKGGGKKR